MGKGAPVERAHPFGRGRAPFWKGMFTLTWWVRKGRAPFEEGAPLLKRARPFGKGSFKCHIENLTY
jgi:hypothetical protein